ncbi:phage tail tape measure protein, partial [Salinivibrio sp. VYel6]|uniref:phage tail tape measure protein n=1 Tax=Salinivibrio sp. VYel6 TaxID=2490493 RepID=UPI00128C4EEF
SASLLSFGMGEERAATAMKNISGRLTMGDAATSAQKNAFNRIGLDSTDIAARMQDDASGTLIDVLDAIKSAPIEEQSALMSQIFGEEAKGAVASLAGNTDKLHKALKLASESQQVHTNSINNEYQDQLEKTEVGISMFMNSITRLSVVFGEAMKPALDAVLGPLGNVISRISDFAEANKPITAGIGMTVAGLIGLKGALLASKAASLIFGNTMDKGRLFRKGLNRETREGGRIAQFAARQWQSLNRAVRNSSPRGGGQYGGEYGAGYEPRKREGLGERVKRKTRRTRARFRRRGRGLGGLIRGGIGMLMQPALTST